ncbi:DNA replication complex GINS protein SLD5-like isoform X1 [Cimex lectularius]|uniref:DNA replication complex GINS protein SLD5 n=1 Tax=Cimex lectularius TaxID=79782 RepID=A0A8I6SQW0_CIMLE|nr:DNA replication complex GINS protein SLD5-like isoform X1 [Cimex lectularius]
MADIEEMFLGEEEDEEVMTAKAVLNVINEAWSNEKLSPELLPHKAEFVEVMIEQVEQMEENVKGLDPTDLRSLIHRHELERIKFLLRSYLRTRLSKIETYSMWLYRNPDSLSPQEAVYLKEYLTLSVNPLKAMCERMPGPVGQLNPNQMEIAPDFETHVFIKSKEDLNEAIIIQNNLREDEVTIGKDSQHIIPYISIRDHVKSSKISLI